MMNFKFKTLPYLSLLVALAFVVPVQGADEATDKQEAAPQEKAEKPAAETAPAHKHSHEKAPATKDAKDAKKKVKTKLSIGKDDTVIIVGDMHCKHCAKKIAGRLYTVKGVAKVRTDVKADVAIITPQKKKKLSTKALWSAAQKAGFQPTELEGPSGKYIADAKTKGPKLVPKPEKTPKEKVAKKPA